MPVEWLVYSMTTFGMDMFGCESEAELGFRKQKEKKKKKREEDPEHQFCLWHRVILYTHTHTHIHIYKHLFFLHTPSWCRSLKGSRKKKKKDRNLGLVEGS